MGPTAARLGPKLVLTSSCTGPMMAPKLSCHLCCRRSRSSWAPPAFSQRTRLASLPVLWLLLAMARTAMAAAFANKAALQDAVNDYCSDPAAAEATHGPIGAWDVSAVTDMDRLVRLSGCRATFDADINSWDVSSVTNMRVRPPHAQGWGWVGLGRRGAGLPHTARGAPATGTCLS